MRPHNKVEIDKSNLPRGDCKAFLFGGCINQLSPIHLTLLSLFAWNCYTIICCYTLFLLLKFSLCFTFNQEDRRGQELLNIVANHRHALIGIHSQPQSLQDSHPLPTLVRLFDRSRCRGPGVRPGRCGLRAPRARRRRLGCGGAAARAPREARDAHRWTARAGRRGWKEHVGVHQSTRIGYV